MLNSTLMRIMIVLALSLLSQVAQVDLAQARIDSKLPLFELGLTGGVFDLPDYPGSDQSRVRTLILPYYIYRGQVIRAGDGKIVGGQFVDSAHLELDISMSAAFPVTSNQNIARDGMPDLDWIGEVGPQLVYHLAPYSRLVELDFVLPFRFVFSTDFTRMDSRGAMLTPGFNFTHRATFDPNVSFFARVSGKFATRSMLEYLYEVPDEYATASRPAYQAEGGFMGMEYSIALSQRFNDKLRFISAIRTEVFNGTTNVNSPLMRQKTNTTFFIGFLWIFAESRKRAFEMAMNSF